MANSDISIEATAVWKTHRIDPSRAISLTVSHGEIVLLTGRTGSGKTTLLNLLSGYERLDGGEVRLRLRDRIIAFGVNASQSHVSPRRLALCGLGRSFQAPPPLSHLTIREIWSIATRFKRSSRVLADSDMLCFLKDSGVAVDQPGAMLPFGHRKLFGVCLAVAIGTDLVFLDEPLAGLSQHLSERVTTLVKNARVQGRTILIAEHRETSSQFGARGFDVWPENV